jgi:Ca2+-binding RTX toxin-like protein
MSTGVFIQKGSGADYLSGTSMDDTLDGGSGADYMSGGLGDDVYYVDTIQDVVIEYAGEGVDTIVSKYSYSLANLSAEIENLVLMSTATNATGNGLNNRLVGNARDNVLDGGAGVDTMIGGAGDDTYVVDAAQDIVIEASDEGYDGVKAYVSYTLPGQVEWLTLTTAASAVTGVGNARDNLIKGNSNANELYGQAGNDTLDGGVGADTMVGGDGDDLYIVGVKTDVVDETSGSGFDVVNSTVTYALDGKASGVEGLVLISSGNINAYGNALANWLQGREGKNLLEGGAGDDTLDGGIGADTLRGGAAGKSW